MAATGEAALIEYLAEQTGRSASALRKALQATPDGQLQRLVETECEERNWPQGSWADAEETGRFNDD